MIKGIMKYITTISIIFSMFCMYGTPVSLAAQSSVPMFFLQAESFKDMGTWTLDTSGDTFLKETLKGKTGQAQAAGTTMPAKASFKVTETGEYKIWARTRDFDSAQGTRFFRIRINGSELNHTFGQHTFNGWKWEDGGSVSLPAGETTLELLDTSGFYARVDGILLVKDNSYVPPDNYQDIVSLVKPVEVEYKSIAYPEWAKAYQKPTGEYSIKSDKMEIKFYEVPTPQGNIIKNEIYLNQNGQMIKTYDIQNDFAYLLMYVKEGKSAGSLGQYPQWNNTFEEDGSTRTITTPDIFKSGVPKWLIPSSVKVNGQTATLTAENDVAKLTAVWTLENNSDIPLVKVHLDAKADGAFSLGMFNGPETPQENVSYILDSYKHNSKRIPDKAYLVTEHYSTSASSLMTVNSSGKEISYAAVVDPSCVPFRWVYEEDSKFGLGILGMNKGVQPYIFAPLFGRDQSTMKAGGSFDFAYRPVTTVGGWYDCYKKVLDIYGVADVRKNYFSSLTDAANNMAKLEMDDDASGWDPRVKSNDNIEGRNVSTISDPLSIIQLYLLSGDEAAYEKRALPVMENILSRKNWHFTATGETAGSAGYLDFKKPSDVGGPIDNFGTAVYGGAYLMTRGQAPIFRNIGIDNGVKNEAASPWMPSFAEPVWMYKYTGDEQYLKDARKSADQYIENVVHKPRTDVWQDTLFVNLTSFPFWSPLLDLYEVCGEQKYLDAAAECARIQMSTLWTQPMVPQGDITISADKVRANVQEKKTDGMYYKGDTQQRLGIPDKLDALKDETVPAWVVSRIGIGIEQPSTFKGNKASMISMANWAPDFLRLAKYTGDQTFETIARNAIIGRWSNYPGYNVYQFTTQNMKPDYPYEGPDVSNIYYHHIPVMRGLAQDYLITQAWKWSDAKIVFPFVRQQGYVWFNNRHYGFEPGRFFDRSNMWLWLKDGLAKPDNKQIDWIAARDDGTFALALMNEDSTDITTTVSLGDEVTGGSDISGAAVLYNAEGEKSEIAVQSNSITVTVPAHGLIGITVNAPNVKKPEFADVPLNTIRVNPSDNAYDLPQQDNDFGTGSILQINPSYYHAYVYEDDKPDTTSKVVLNYKVGDGDWQKADTQQYPYEFSIKVTEPEKAFQYNLEVYDKNGNVKKSPDKTMLPVDR